MPAFTPAEKLMLECVLDTAEELCPSQTAISGERIGLGDLLGENRQMLVKVTMYEPPDKIMPDIKSVREQIERNVKRVCNEYRVPRCFTWYAEVESKTTYNSPMPGWRHKGARCWYVKFGIIELPR